MDLVRRELGQDAVVVESKEVATRRLLPWLSRRQEVEVVAEPLPRPAKIGRPNDQETNSANTVRQGASNRTVRTLAETMVPTLPPRQLLTPMPQFQFDAVDPVAEAGSGNPNHRWQPPTPQIPPTNPVGEQAPVLDAQACHETLKSLQSIVTQLKHQSETAGKPEIPQELLPTYRRLIDAEIDDFHARELIDQLRQHSSPDSPAAVVATLTAFIEREMRCAPPIRPTPGRRQVVLVAGPTGVGKTTTIAKLAGHFRLREQIRVGLITVDNYRVGAVEQLQTYADILQLPLKVAANGDELRNAVDELDDVDLIFVDTAGRSPLDGAKMDELCQLVRMSGADQTLLALSLAAGTRQLSHIAAQFSAAVPTSLVLTKLDETAGCGGILSVARQIPYPVSYLTTGQDVPDQIEPAHPHRLTRLILGRDSVLQVVSG